MTNLDVFVEYLPFIIPVLILQSALAIAAVVHLLKNPNYRFGNRTMWIFVVVFIQIIGPVVYFTVGRGQA